MKYKLRLCSRPEDCSIKERHQHLVAGLLTIDGEWGLAIGEYSTPEAGKELSAIFKLGKYLGKGIKGSVSYRYRGGLRDEGDCDDLLTLEFDPTKINFEELVKNVFPRYATVFGAYLGYICDEEFTHIDFNRTRNVNGRHTLVRFYPTGFFDEQFCGSAIGITPEGFRAKSEGLVSYARLMRNGVCYSAKVEPMEIAEAERFNDAMQLRFFSASNWPALHEHP